MLLHFSAAARTSKAAAAGGGGAWVLRGELQPGLELGDPEGDEEGDVDERRPSEVVVARGRAGRMVGKAVASEGR
jgi:hypothetical protein